MVKVSQGSDDLRYLFRALTETTFHGDLGVADPPLVDYLSGLLERFVRIDAIFRVRDLIGQRLEQVADMLLAAEERQHNVRRELHRHIGDFALFWTGVYPEALKKLRHPEQKDALLDYQEQGKRSYLIASTFDNRPYEDEAPILRRLSDQFELCSLGLNRVRREWERLQHRSGGDYNPAWN
ncbi:MAG: hypothetical protein KDA75_17875 [Planctomycetaceae bacterium]|nr:hypothetical protein [Planctomycetaceae bacterium]